MTLKETKKAVHLRVKKSLKFLGAPFRKLWTFFKTRFDKSQEEITWPKHLKHEQPCKNDCERSEVLAEYAALRTEIVATLQLRSRIQMIAVVVLGVFLGLGFADTSDLVSPTILLCYPLLILFLAIEYARRDLRVAEIGDYIQYYIESRCPEIWWETYFHKAWPVKGWFYRMKWIGAMGMFVGSGVLAVILFLIDQYNDLQYVDWVLFFLDAGALLLTWYILGVRRRRQRPPLRKPSPNELEGGNDV